VDAMLELGDIYRNGVYVEKDDRVAVRWYQEAINNKCHEGFMRMGKLYVEQKNMGLAIKYYARGHQKMADKSSVDTLKLRVKINQLMVGEKMELIDEWILLVDQNVELQRKITNLEGDNEKLRSEVLYQPEGDGYENAKSHFLSMSKRL